MASSDTRRLRVVVTGDSGQAQQALEQVGKSSEKSESRIASLAKTAAGFAGKGVLAFGAVGAAAATMGFSAATNLETVTVGFTTMLGSATKAQKFLKQLQQFANTTPFEFNDVTGAAQKFLSMGFAAKDVIPMLTSVGDAVAAMGGGAEQIDSVTTALSQMKIKGKVAGDEIMQLSEQGVPALQILADGFGVSTGQMSKMITNGKVLSDKAIPMIVKGLEDGTKHVKGFGGMMANQSETMKGKWSTFMDTMKTGLGNLATKFLPTAKKAVDLASAGFQAFFSGLSGKEAGKGIDKTFGLIGLAIADMVKAFQTGTSVTKGFIGKLELVTATAKNMFLIFTGTEIASEAENPFTKAAHFIVNDFVPAVGKAIDGITIVIGWLREHDKVAAALAITMGSLVAVTKLYGTVTAIQAAGGIASMVKNLSVIQSVMKVVTALQWAYNGALAVAAYLQIAGYLSAMAIAQKAVAFWSKIVTAAQWLWNLALDANPIGIVVIAIAALVAAVILLWKNNEGFRNFVVNVLWKSIKAAWDGIVTGVKAAVGGLIAAWNGFKNFFVGIWNAIVGFIGPIIGAIVTFFTPLANAIGKIASVFNAFYINVWKAIWILIQIAVKIFVIFFQATVSVLNTAIHAIGNALSWLFHAIWDPIWGLMKATAQLVADWFMTKIVPSWNRAFTQVKNFLIVLKTAFLIIWDAIKNKVVSVFNSIAGPVMKIWSNVVNTFQRYLAAFKISWNIQWDAIKKKIDSVVDGVKKAFNGMKDGIKAAWDKIVSLTKAPVNFVINQVYNDKIRTFFNKLASSFGIKTRLDPIKGFAKGGVAPGTGRGDTVPAMLTPGEGILTTREMKALGGKKGFYDLRRSLTGYKDGGVVGTVGGWAKSLTSKASGFIRGMASGAIKPLVNTLRSFINGHLSSDGLSGYLRSGGNTVLDELVSWVKGQDKSAGAMGNGSVMGWQNMLRAINAAGFNFHPSVGQTYGGGHAAGSYHYQGRAIDLSPPSMKAFNWILSTYGKNIKELIYGPAGGRSIKDGKPHQYSNALLGQHYNHVHWAMDDASTVQPGWFQGYNGTGKPETLVNADRYGAGLQIDNVYITLTGTGYTPQDVKNIRDELLKLGKRNGGRSGLPKS